VIGDTTRALLRPVSDILPFVRGLRILNPTYQFYQVLALWGCVVLATFLVWRRCFSGNAYLLGAMAAPLLTVFNPVFVENLYSLPACGNPVAFCTCHAIAAGGRLSTD
jgi:hypothetical protein